MYLIRSNISGRVPRLLTVETRRSGSVAVTILVALAALLWLGLATQLVARGGVETGQREVRAQRFVVVDDAGNERAELGILASGQPSLRIWDEARTIAATLEIDQAGMPRLAFENIGGAPLTELGVLDKRYPVFILRSADGKRRLGVAVAEAGVVSIGLYDTHKRNRCSLSLDEDGQPQLRLKDGKGNDRVRLMIGSDGACALDLLDPKGRERAVLQVDGQGEPDGVLLGPDRKPLWSARSSSN